MACGGNIPHHKALPSSDLAAVHFLKISYLYKPPAKGPGLFLQRNLIDFFIARPVGARRAPTGPPRPCRQPGGCLRGGGGPALAGLAVDSLAGSLRNPPFWALPLLRSFEDSVGLQPILSLRLRLTHKTGRMVCDQCILCIGARIHAGALRLY